MRLSHSKLGLILSCPMSYYLNYYQGIGLRDTKTAFAIGSAVHYGIEHSTSDLSEYFKENGGFKSRLDYGYDQLLSEAMVYGYLKHKERIFEDILTISDPLGRPIRKLTLEDEQHELYITGKLKSHLPGVKFHDFVGIVDLLLLTNEGFIIVDYKTSSNTPNWSDYLEQVYRYIFLLQTAFPEVPIVKIGIINVRKTKIRQSKGENQSQFYARLKLEYEINDENYVNFHAYSPETLDSKLLEAYIANMSRMADSAHLTDERKQWYINYGSAMGMYGKSTYYDIFYRTPDAFILYNITDHIYNTETKTFDKVRNCVPLDMQVIELDNKILNKYELFRTAITNVGYDKEYTNNWLKKNYRTDDSLLELYWLTFEKEVCNGS